MINFKATRNNSTYNCAECSQIINDEYVIEFGPMTVGKGTAMHTQSLYAFFHRHCFVKTMEEIVVDIRRN